MTSSLEADMTGTVVATNHAPISRANNGCLIDRPATLCGLVNHFDAIRPPHRAQDVTLTRVLAHRRRAYNYVRDPTC